MTARSSTPPFSRRSQPAATERTNVSELDRRRPAVRAGLGIAQVVILVGLFVVCAGPLLWLFKASTSTSQDIISAPLAPWPSGFTWSNFVEVWTHVNFGSYLWNTALQVVGSVAAMVLVSATAAYGLAVLRPGYARVVQALILATLFIPGVVSLVPLYLTVVDVPLVHASLIHTFWAIWLPAGASAFNVLLIQRFFEGLPVEIFEAARIDGAGPLRLFLTIVVPMSKPILVVASLLAAVGSYKDFLWPLLVLKPSQWPISVVLAQDLAKNSTLAELMAALFISVAVPVGLFLVFQRQFLAAAGNSGAVKG